jgi:uncharacterized DUF497 family protein
MTKWNEFVPEEIEYDFENDKLQKHGLTIDESVQCFYNPYTIRKTKNIRTDLK